MPRYKEAKKDVGGCENFRGVVYQTEIRKYPNEETHLEIDIL
jgi:hypothetical protein